MVIRDTHHRTLRVLFFLSLLALLCESLESSPPTAAPPLEGVTSPAIAPTPSAPLPSQAADQQDDSMEIEPESGMPWALFASTNFTSNDSLPSFYDLG